MSVIRFLERPAPIALDPAIALLANEPEGLAFDFMNMRGYIRDRSTPGNNWMGDPNAKLNYAAPSAKLVMGADGVFRSGTALHCEYNAAREPLGIRVESQRTNLIIESEFRNGLGSVTSVQNATPSTFPRLPNNTGFAMQADGLLAFAGRPTPALTEGSSYVFSVFVQMDDGLGPPVFNGASGSASNNDFALVVQNGAIAPNTYTVEDLGQDLYRVSGVRVATVNTQIISLYRYANNRRRAFRFSGYQIELGAFPSSYIPTTTAQVTRAQDDISLLISLTPWSISAGTFFSEFELQMDGTTNTGSVFSVGELPGGNNSNFYAAIQRRRENGSSTSGTNPAGIWAGMVSGSFRKVAVAADFVGVSERSAINGAVTADVTLLATLSPSAAGRFGIGQVRRSITAQFPLDGHIRSIKWIPRYATNAELQAMTA